jgi:hypothetical protein
MKRNLQQKLSPSQKTSIRAKFIIGAFTVGVTCSIAWFVFINVSNNTETKASIGSNGWSLNNGEVISNFTWENGEPTKAATGPDAIKISPTAYIAFGGKNSTGGLAPGNATKDINMEIEAAPLFNTEGIDISIDYRGTEPSGSFFTRGKTFDFGFENGFLSITYRVQTGKSYQTISETTNYELINDGLYRNYRFIYTPATGKGEIFVNSVIVWSYESPRNTALWWNTTDNIIIAKGIDGGGNDTPLLDNLTIRTTGTLSPLAESLIGFNLKTMTGVVTITWTTTANSKVDYFTIQRSINGTDFTTITTVKADPIQKESEEYTFTDKNFTIAGIYYYRIRQTFTDGKFVTHNISATKVTVSATLAIEKITPTMFKNSFSVAYSIPEEGKVQWQLIDGRGTVKTTETVEAQKGKNIFQFNDTQKLPEGEYTLNLVYNETKLTATVTKNLSGIF